MSYFQNYTTKGNFFISSDIHYSHKNIVRGTTSWRNEDGSIPMGSVRDFDRIEDMNDTIVNNFNELVKEDDILFLLGDIAFGGYKNIEVFLDRLVCKNISLIYGNHDHNIRNNVYGLQDRFMGCYDYREISLKNRDFIMCHYPLQSWNKLNKGAIHLHGHVHLPKHLRLGSGKMMDVGVDGNDLKPYHIDEIFELVRNQPIKSGLELDHHLDRVQGVVG